MESIWNNDFYRKQPALAWVYKLDMSNYYTGDDEGKINTKILSNAIIDISVGKRSSEYADVYYGGIASKVFTRAQNPDTVTIKFSENKDYDVTTVLENMYNLENFNQLYPTENELMYNTAPTEGPHKLIVNIYNPVELAENTEKPMHQYIFYNARLVTLDEIQYSYESTEAITRTATFVYNYMVFKNKSMIEADETAIATAINSQKKKEELAETRKERAAAYADKLSSNNATNLNAVGVIYQPGVSPSPNYASTGATQRVTGRMSRGPEGGPRR
jgi:hypothetical protein